MLPQNQHFKYHPSNSSYSSMFGSINTILGIVAFLSIVTLIKPSLFHRVYKNLSRKHGALVLIGIIIFYQTPVGTWINAGAKKEEAKQAEIKQQEDAKAAAEKAVKDAAAARELANKQEEQKKVEKEQLKTRLIEAQDEVKKISTEGEKWRKQGINGIDAELLLFASWTGAITEARKLNDPEMTQIADRLSNAVSQAQVREFPLLRKAFTEQLDNKGWEFDLDARSFGTGNKNLELVNAAFAANKNIAQIHVALGDKLKLLRFTRVNYKWYSGASEYQYYDIDSLKDSDVSLPKTE